MSEEQERLGNEIAEMLRRWYGADNKYQWERAGIIASKIIALEGLGVIADKQIPRIYLGPGAPEANAYEHFMPYMKDTIAQLQIQGWRKVVEKEKP